MSFFSGIGKMVLALLLLIGIGVTACEVNKAYWDRQVRELCELDGGVVVYEHVELTSSEFEGAVLNEGNRYIPFQDESSDSAYFLEDMASLEIKRYPFVRRDELRLVRRSDGVVLATQIYYGRRGGDFPTGLNETSHFGCSDIGSVKLDLIGSTFSIIED